jgi:hypothetical protein
VTGRAAQPILAGEGWQGICGLAAAENNGRKNQRDSCERSRKLQDVAEMTTTRNVHGRTPRQDQIKIWLS